MSKNKKLCTKINLASPIHVYVHVHVFTCTVFYLELPKEFFSRRVNIIGTCWVSSCCLSRPALFRLPELHLLSFVRIMSDDYSRRTSGAVRRCSTLWGYTCNTNTNM